MRAIVLAAGRGSRLKQMTEERPKCLITVLGKPLLQWQTEALTASGLEQIAVVRGYRKAEIDFPGLTFFDNDRWAETNMVRSLLCADDWLSADDCVVSYADLLYPPQVVEKLLLVQAEIAITYDPNWLALWSERFEDPLTDSETFEVDDQGKLVAIGQRALHVSEIHGQYMGLLKFTPAGWKKIKHHLSELQPSVIDRLDMTSLLSRLIQAGMTVQTVSIDNEWWFEIDSIRDQELACRKLGEEAPKHEGTSRRSNEGKIHLS